MRAPDRQGYLARQLFLALVLLFTCALVAGCSQSGGSPAVSDSQPTRTLPTPPLLPHSVYFLDGMPGAAQVWRMETDGFTRVQVSDEAGGVDDFSVSPADGSLAVITNNRLFLVDRDGDNRRLVADGSQVDPNIEDYIFHGLVEAPVFSPDGQTLAYAFDGLHLYDLTSGEDEHVLTNLGNLLGEQSVFAKEAYSPGGWSPDGRRLLIVMGYFEGSTLAVMDLQASQPFTRMRSEGPVCCQYSWAPDGNSILVANPDYGVSWPGLWQYDAATGEETVLVQSLEQDGSANFTGWPVRLPSGDLLYFHANIHFSPDVGIPLVLVRSQADPPERTPLRPEVFHPHEVLWAPDGSLALIVQSAGEGSLQMVLVPTDGSPLQVLLERERMGGLAWGP